MRKVDIFDTTLRDGEQVPGASLNRDEKIQVAHQLAELGVDVIEAGFAASSPGDFAAVKNIAEQVEGPVITALARAVESDIIAVAEAVKPAKRPRIHIVLGTSDTHLKHKFRKSRQQIMDMGVQAVVFAKELCEDIEYSTEDASRSDFDYLCETVEAVIDAGATVVNIPDTVGYAVPEQWGDLISRLIATVPNIERARVSVHCHKRPGHGDGQFPGGDQGGCDPGRMHRQRRGRTGGQRLAGRDRHGGQDARRFLRRAHRYRDHAESMPRACWYAT